MSYKETFLLVFAAVVLHVPLLAACILIVGYWGFASLDKWLAVRAREKVIEDEIFGWTVDPDDSELEAKGDIGRVKLPAKELAVVNRVAQLLRRIP